MTSSLVCGNKGCGKSYSENHDAACEYHSGNPVFHDGLKGWSCCKKRVSDFAEFLQLPGCTVGPHVPKPAEEPKKPSEPKPTKSTTDAPKLMSKTATGVEVYSTNGAQKLAVPQPSAVVPQEPTEPEIKEEDLFDPPNAVVPQGTKCKRRTCEGAYEGPESYESECVYHPGEPIFHEGSKGWTCCPRKVLEFEEFLKLKGCKTGKHRFTDLAKPKVEQIVQCRHDWYQTPSTVIISIFAKKSDKTKSKIELLDTEIKASIVFKDTDGTEKTFNYNTALFQPIIPSESKVTYLSTKVEIVLKKSNGISWGAIEPTSNLTTWTTFGATGSYGSVGAKTAVIAADSPLFALKK